MLSKKELRGKTGIYLIRNTINGKVYVGSSSNIAERWTEHARDLKNNTHRNKPLQNAYNKYGKDKFIYEILELLDENNKDKQFEREQYWINTLNACNKKVGYNIQNKVLVVPRATKKVVCLETGEIFNSLEEAGKVKKVSSGSISCCCNKKKLKQTGGFHWRFYDEFITMTDEEVKEVIFDVKSYPFICLDSGKIYRSWRELPYKKGSIARCCGKLAKGEYATCHGRKYMFLKDYNKLTSEEIENIKNLKLEQHNSGEVICLETKELYKHAREAMISTGIFDSGILKCCYNESITCGNYHWMFKKDYDKFSKEQIKSKIKTTGKNVTSKAVICLETREVFKSGVDASNSLRLSKYKISKMCINKGINPLKKDVHCMFLEDFKKLSEQEIEIIINKGMKHIRKVQCVETGRVFNSVTEAAKSVGSATSNISKCCKNQKCICKGFHWTYV